MALNEMALGVSPVGVGAGVVFFLQCRLWRVMCPHSLKRSELGKAEPCPCWMHQGFIKTFPGLRSTHTGVLSPLSPFLQHWAVLTARCRRWQNLKSLCVHITKIPTGKGEGIFRVCTQSILEMNFYLFGLLCCLRPLECAGPELDEQRLCGLQNSWEHFSGKYTLATGAWNTARLSLCLSPQWTSFLGS